MSSETTGGGAAWTHNRSRAPDAKRGAVLAAAAEAFVEKGYAATSIDDVAALLGVSKPTIYYYAGGKQALLGACFSVALDAYSAAVDQDPGAEHDGRGKLRTVIFRYVEITTTVFGRCLHRVPDVELTHEVRDRLRAVKRAVDARIRDLLRQGVADGSLITADVRMATFAISGAMNSIAQWYSPEGELGAEEIAHRLWETFSEGFGPR